MSNALLTENKFTFKSGTNNTLFSSVLSHCLPLNATKIIFPMEALRIYPFPILISFGLFNCSHSSKQVISLHICSLARLSTSHSKQLTCFSNVVLLIHAFTILDISAPAFCYFESPLQNVLVFYTRNILVSLFLYFKNNPFSCALASVAPYLRFCRNTLPLLFHCCRLLSLYLIRLTICYLVHLVSVS